MRAQRPIVSDVKRTFEAASKSAASEREIQSVGDFDIGQSASLGAVSRGDPPDDRLDASSEDPPDDRLDAPSEDPPDDRLDAPSEDPPDDRLDASSEDPPDDPSVPEPAPDATLEPGSRGPLFADLVGARSFRAQPVPLKWTAGTPKVFFIGEPHSGHVAGPWPWTECMTSI